MGIGKTKISLDKMAQHYRDGDIEALVVFCPCSIRFNWVREISLHCAVAAESYVLSKLQTKKDTRDFIKFLDKNPSDFKILIVGTESVQTKTSKVLLGVRDFISKHKYAVIVDEAHDIKNPKSNRSQNIIDVSKNAEYRLAMTGTPISQGILDLYGIFDFIDSNIIGVGDYWSFRNRYCVMEDIRIDMFRKAKQIVGYQNIDELLDTIKPFVFEARKKDVLDLPNKTFMVRKVSLSAEHKSIYNEMQRNRQTSIGNNDINITAKNAISAYSALQQIAGGYVSRGTGSYTNSGDEIRELVEVVSPNKNPKIVELKKVISEIPDDQQIIIWARYRSEIKAISEALKDYRKDEYENDCAVFIDQTDEKRSKIISEMTDKKTRYFISTQQSGGTGITLTSVAYVIYYSNLFSYRDRAQSEDRNHRIGQERNVTYIDLVAEGTVDETILGVLKDKKNLADYVMQNLKNGITPL
jgi:SNF2 family DNA or RNA helicase